MLEAHAWNAILVIAADALAAGWGFYYVIRKRPPNTSTPTSLAAAQAIVIAQVALGLLLVSDGPGRPTSSTTCTERSPSRSLLSPWIYAPPVPAKRLAWFPGAALLAGALAVRAYTTSG